MLFRMLEETGETVLMRRAIKVAPYILVPVAFALLTSVSPRITIGIALFQLAMPLCYCEVAHEK